MGLSVCRTGDIVTGTCYGHSSPRSYTGNWITAGGPVSANGLRTILVGDLGNTDCGHQFQAVGGSNNVNENGIKLQRVGDPVMQPTGASYTLVGQSITGSSNVTAL